ncbi:TapB family protein [Robiginitalea sediminis]|uniref:TapB family protein n=1 Tax=Robiginitalea sediminis TaxID=1982593 RepID=UPI000B4B8F1D|nr:hypothetical protein [Robiginitalea sediminis]
MKTNFFFTPSALLIILAALTSGKGMAQACSTYYPMKEGVRLEYTLYDKKDKVEGTQWQEFRNVQETSEGLEAEVHMGFSDAKGKEVYETSYGMTCNGSVIRIDYQSLLSGPMLDQYGEMEAEITGTDMELPNNLEVGMELPDSQVTMTIDMGAMNMKMEVEVTGRKVEKKETVTTAAGSFECFVIYSDTRSKMMMANQNFPTRTWIAPDVGMVKSESYNKSGKLTSRMELSGISG